MFSSLYHISGEVVKEETEEVPKEVAQNGLENSEKGKICFSQKIVFFLTNSFLLFKMLMLKWKFFRLYQLICPNRHGEESSGRTVPD